MQRHTVANPSFFVAIFSTKKKVESEVEML